MENLKRTKKGELENQNPWAVKNVCSKASLQEAKSKEKN